MPVKQKRGVEYVRNELVMNFLAYRMIQDCIDGELAIKGFVGIGSGGVNISFDASAFNGGGSNQWINASVAAKAKRYLPMPNESDQSEENKQRYRAYLTRAVFYNVTGRTLDGMVGQIFLIPPVIKLPTQLNGMLTDSDGNGLTLIQNAYRGVRHTLPFGRAGLFTDYPTKDSNDPTTVSDLVTGTIQPMIKCIAPWNIINWQTRKINGKNVLSMIVFVENVDNADDDGFSVSQSKCHRVLRLDDSNEYTLEDYQCDEGNSSYKPQGPIKPTDSTGKPFKYIPFTFIGSENNDAGVDKPPMFDLSVLNIAHFRNSADYEEASFMVGQPTVVATGLTKDWVEDVLKGKIPLGSRAGISLPVGADAKLLQASPNQMPLVAMQEKEDQMVAIGAKLVIQKRVQKTATEAIVDSSSESSVLANVANNVSAAFRFAIGVACEFVGADKTKIDFILNTDFELNRMTSDDQSKLVADWQKGAIAGSEMRAALRKSGIATLDDVAWRAEVAKEQATMVTLGPIANPFNNAEPPAVPGADPNANPVGHAKNPATRGA